MKYGKIKKTDIANGEGVRVSIWVSGCRLHCPGCFNEEAQDFDYGEVFDGNTIGQILLALSPDYIAGLTILGGEPLDCDNLYMVTILVKIFRMNYPSKTLWIYTGYKYEDVKDLPIMDYVDVLVDGSFKEDLKDITLNFRGSANQRLIDVKATKRSGSIELWRSKYEKGRI